MGLALRSHYVARRARFPCDAAIDALRRFRATVEFVQLADAPVTVGSDDPDSTPESLGHEEPKITPPASITPTEKTLDKTPETPPVTPQASRSTSTVQVTYSPTEWALLQGKFPMSEADWDAMIGVLQAMKRGLVTPEDAES